MSDISAMTGFREMNRETELDLRGVLDPLDQINMGASRNMANTLFLELRHLIITGELAPGYLFPSETMLCERIGIGRTTLREAYQALESANYITRTKRGTFVNKKEAIQHSMPFIMQIEMSDMRDLTEFRTMFETELAGIAAKRATLANIEQLELHLENMRKHRGDLQALTNHDTKFHMEIASATHNKLFINTMGMSIQTFFKGMYTAFQIDTEENVDQAIAYHESILFAVREGNVDLARSAMRSHITSVSRRLS